MEKLGKIKGIVSNLVIIETEASVMQKEICYVYAGDEKLMAEVIKIVGKNAYAQVFESTRGLKFGDKVLFSNHLLEVELGPGLLSKKFDGLQNDLDKMEGTFLKRGTYNRALDKDSRWQFTPIAEIGSLLTAGDWIGEVKEQRTAHKIMVPFTLEGTFELTTVNEAGEYGIDEDVATLQNTSTKETISIGMCQKWPITKALQIHKEKPRPFKILETGVRIIDTFNPMAQGGTGFIPGPFGSGKTVLQHAIAKQAEADVIIFAACGERANEIVEIFNEFPKLDDPKTGGKLMDKTIIIANTSNMPVAAREASVYTAMAIGEYYRAMGLKVMMLADSTSRWAQALREMSNRLEELPGPDAFPMDLPSVISAFYARAGYVVLKNGATGSISFIGTVSPAGGNLKEPVTEATKKAARAYYALSQKRADSKRYPAIDPVGSYSKYLEYPEMKASLKDQISPNWIHSVEQAKDIIRKGKDAYDQINILGDDSVPIDYHVDYWKAELLDFVMLQQDAFDNIDAYCPLERQQYMLNRLLEICKNSFHFDAFHEVAPYFKNIINLFKQMNYSEYQSESFKTYDLEVNKSISANQEQIQDGVV